MNNNYTKKEAKKIVKDIFEQEKKKTELNINGLALTIVEFYKSDIYKKNIKLTNPVITFIKTTTPINCAGWFNSDTKELIVMIKEKKINSKKYGLGILIKNTYHEIRHHYQNEKIIPQSDLISFLMKIEDIYKQTSEGYVNYLAEHGSYLVEIDANVYGVRQAIKYIKKEPNLYIKNIKYLEALEEKYNNDSKNYNPYKTFDQCHFLVSKYREDAFKEMPILINFYNQDGSFKSLREILSLKTKLDTAIINLVITSNPFLKEINYEELSERDKIDLIMTLKNEYEMIIKCTTNLTPVKEKTKSLVRKMFMIFNQKTKNQELASKQEHLETINKIFLEESKNRKK